MMICMDWHYEMQKAHHLETEAYVEYMIRKLGVETIIKGGRLGFQKTMFETAEQRPNVCVGALSKDNVRGRVAGVLTLVSSLQLFGENP
eukprot:UN01461